VFGQGSIHLTNIMDQSTLIYAKRSYMVQKSDSSRNVNRLLDICTRDTIQINEDLDFCFASFARNSCLTSSRHDVGKKSLERGDRQQGKIETLEYYHTVFSKCSCPGCLPAQLSFVPPISLPFRTWVMLASEDRSSVFSGRTNHPRL